MAARPVRGQDEPPPPDDAEPSLDAAGVTDEEPAVDFAAQTIDDPDREIRAAAPKDDDPRWRAGRTAIALLLGAAAPTGLVGLELAYDLGRELELYAGGGLGLSGPQLALGARATVLRRGGVAYLAGGALATGDAEARLSVDRGGDFVTQLDWALWLEAENAIEFRTEDDWFARGSLGFGVVLAAADCRYVHEAASGLSGNPRTESACATSQRTLVWPFIAFAVGRGF